MAMHTDECHPLSVLHLIYAKLRHSHVDVTVIVTVTVIVKGRHVAKTKGGHKLGGPDAS